MKNLFVCIAMLVVGASYAQSWTETSYGTAESYADVLIEQFSVGAGVVVYVGTIQESFVCTGSATNEPAWRPRCAAIVNNQFPPVAVNETGYAGSPSLVKVLYRRKLYIATNSFSHPTQGTASRTSTEDTIANIPDPVWMTITPYGSGGSGSPG
jgi:hypothetical protein